jgi:molybdopterin synthase catalytic subunit
VGCVRDHSEENVGVTQLQYEAWENVAESMIEEICVEARDRWPHIVKVAVQHRIGTVNLGEPAVAVATSAPHRGDALESCSWLIDEIKRRVPIWKKEIFDGGSSWVSCAHDEVSASGGDAK